MVAEITLENMEFYAFHGCYTEEQRVGNRFRVQLTLRYDATLSASTDNVLEAVNYLRVYEIVREQMMITSHILEHVCSRILEALRSSFEQLLAARITVTKLAPPLGGPLTGVGVTMSF